MLQQGGQQGTVDTSAGPASEAAKTATNPPDDDEEPSAPPADGRGSSDRRPRRGAVSAEVYSEDDATNYVKTVRIDDVGGLSLSVTYRRLRCDTAVTLSVH